jgi:hypothetical protein
MDKSQKIRWAVLLSALSTTIVAIIYPVDELPEPAEAMVRKPIPAAHAAAVSQPNVQGRRMWIANDEDPFAPRTWDAPPPPVEAARTVQRVELAQDIPVSEAPPPLPYRFLGQMQDGSNRIFYLGRGDQVLLARQGEVLESTYKVVAVGDSAIEFESVQSGVRQSLSIPAQ